MKRFAAFLALSFLLAACGSKIVQFTVTFSTTDDANLQELRGAVTRVIEGRVLAKQKKVLKQDMAEAEGKTVVTVTLPDAETAQMLKDGLTAPFSMSIMKQVETGQGDIISEKFGEFKETGIVTKHVDWVIGGTVKDATDGKATAVIVFTKEGEALVKDLFVKNRGAVIGIFVREQLMSKKLIDAKDANLTSIAIDGIPSEALAKAFADDVNVGLHVTFTAMP